MIGNSMKMGGFDTAITADQTISGINGNRLFTNEGAVGTVVLTLPSAKVGDEFCGLVRATQVLTFNPSGSEKISTTAGVMGVAGKAISADADGEYIHAVCFKDGEWTILDSRGTWTNES